LSEKKAKNRAKALLKFAQIASLLRDSNNYNSLMAISAGISSSTLARLKTTRAILDGKKDWVRFEEIEELMRSERSFETYRNALGRSCMPCIPYLGVVLRDLLYIDEANKDYRADGTLNLAKFLLIGDIILMIQSFQLKNYGQKRSTNIADLIFSQEIYSDGDLFQKSLNLEPKEK